MKAEEFRPEKVAVLGLGTMGHGIAQTFAVAGFPVGCFDEEPAARARSQPANIVRYRIQSGGNRPQPAVAVDQSIALSIRLEMIACFNERNIRFFGQHRSNSLAEFRMSIDA